MGIVNITPNSFSDGGACLDPAAAVAHALALVDQGATILDLGAEASSFFRPGVVPVPADEQLLRLLPALTALLPQLPSHVRVSVDTRDAAVARETLAAGAHLINDISAGTHDPALFAAVAARPGRGLILMHIGDTYPATPPADDPDILATVRSYLHARADAAQAAGIPQSHIAIDPGVGFGKTMADNWRLALRCQELQHPTTRYPIVLGASRKRFLETPPPAHLHATWQAYLRTFAAQGTHPRDPATAALTALAEANIHRVHEVTLARAALTMP
jgi:dihydropteroate synthase